MCVVGFVDKRSDIVCVLRNATGRNLSGVKLSVVFLILINVSAINVHAFEKLTDLRGLQPCGNSSNTTYSKGMDDAGDNSGSVELVEDGFGYIESIGRDGAPCYDIVRRFTMSNHNGMVVQIITYGATITSIQVPDRDGSSADVVLGYDNIEGYRSRNNPYFGAVVGRVANRIRDGKFKIGDQQFQLSVNRPNFHLHGGFKGFDKVLWESHVEGTKLTLSYLSRDGEEGYPGTLLAHATYQLTPDNELILEMKATSTKPTPVNIVNHSYFNLAGHGSGAEGLFEHRVSINADKYTRTDGTNIPNGLLGDVGGTYLDLRIPKMLRELLPVVPGGGFDSNLCIGRGPLGEMNFVARVEHPKSGRVLEVHSDQPGVQFYTGNFLPDANATSENEIIGKGGIKYYKWGGLCLETQNYPDAVNHKNFPDCILNPGNEYSHRVVYRFSVASSE
ncbi:galactose mutarotase [Anabrus simplex]|uniref:galactose mutarotase n=1 Tax=Anabrus simplex TaxID=316456 RepID=UPI0034DDB482